MENIAKYHGYYIYRGEIFAVLGECKMRVDHGWVTGVVYLREGETYCITKRDFVKSFKKTTLRPTG